MKLIKTVVCVSILGVLISCGGHPKPKPVPPSIEELSYINDIVLSRPEGASYFEAEIPSTINYRTPKADNCNDSTTATHTFTMDADDYIDVTLTDNPGVDPGPLNTRAYVLEKKSRVLGIVFPDLIMEQTAPAQYRLQVERWKLKLNGNQDLSREKGNGSQYAPALGLPPFERIYPSQSGVVPPIGGTWRLGIKTTSVNTTLSVTLSFHATNGPFKICH